MTHQTAQKVAKNRANPLHRVGEIRAVLGRPSALRAEAQRLLDAVPRGCDLLAWSPEGYNIALVASVLAEEIGEELTVHRASLVAPLAPPLRAEPWTWVCAEELLGVGAPRTWATKWAAAQLGTPYGESVVSVALVQ